MKARIIITLDVPKSFDGLGPWPREQCLDDFVHHWLEEGCYIKEFGYGVDPPDGIKYKGYKIEYPEDWVKNKDLVVKKPRGNI